MTASIRSTRVTDFAPPAIRRQIVARGQGRDSRQYWPVGPAHGHGGASTARENKPVIAIALSDVDALLAKLDELIAKKRDLKQAAMQQLLTGRTRLPSFIEPWEKSAVGREFEIQLGKMLDAEKNLGIAKPYIGNKAVQWGQHQSE